MLRRRLDVFIKGSVKIFAFLRLLQRHYESDTCAFVYISCKLTVTSKVTENDRKYGAEHFTTLKVSSLAT